jgi:hypothetical protein
MIYNIATVLGSVVLVVGMGFVFKDMLLGMWSYFK